MVDTRRLLESFSNLRFGIASRFAGCRILRTAHLKCGPKSRQKCKRSQASISAATSFKLPPDSEIALHHRCATDVAVARIMSQAALCHVHHYLEISFILPAPSITGIVIQAFIFGLITRTGRVPLRATSKTTLPINSFSTQPLP
jgi:hypothetical protein